MRLEGLSLGKPCGRIRTIEKGLLTRSDLAKVLDAGNLEGALMALRDSFYGPMFRKLNMRTCLRVALEKQSRPSRQGDETCSEPLIIAAYRARYDFHNLKVLLKAEMLQVPAEEGGFSRLGNLTRRSCGSPEAGTPGQAPVAPLELEPDSIGKRLQGNLRAGGGVCPGVGTSRNRATSSFEVDGLIDKSYYIRLHRFTGSPGMMREEIIRSEIDIINLKMAVRANLLGISSSDFGGILIPGGNVDAARLAEGYIRGYRGVADVYKHARLEHLANRGVSQAQKGQPLTGWERECDNAMVKLVRQARKISLGPEPVFGYMFGREVEVRNLRIILSGKQSLIPEHEISERLRESYA